MHILLPSFKEYIVDIGINIVTSPPLVWSFSLILGNIYLSHSLLKEPNCNWVIFRVKSFKSDKEDMSILPFKILVWIATLVFGYKMALHGRLAFRVLFYGYE